MARGRALSQALLFRRFSWIGAVLVLIAAGISLCILRPRDPVSAGKPLSYWLEQIALNPGSADEAVSAVRLMGTNVIPRLLADLRGDRRMLWRYRVNRLLDKQRLISLRFHGLEDRRRRAKWGFFALAAHATPAIPWLVLEIEAKPVPAEELYALAFTPVFTQMLQSTNPRTKAKAEIALNHIRGKAVEGVTNSKK